MARIAEDEFDPQIARVEMNRGNLEAYHARDIEPQCFDEKDAHVMGTFCGFPVVVDYGMPDDLVYFRNQSGELKGMIYNLAPPLIGGDTVQHRSECLESGTRMLGALVCDCGLGVTYTTSIPGARKLAEEFLSKQHEYFVVTKK